MKLETILGINATNADNILGRIRNRNAKVIMYGKKRITVRQALEMFDPNLHDIHSTSKRKDKYIKVPDPDFDESNPENANIEPPLVTQKVDVNRVSSPQQKLIVNRHVAFLTGNPLSLKATAITPKQKTLLEALMRLDEKAKMPYLNTDIGRIMSSETHCAELWYPVDQSESDSTDFDGIEIDTKGLTIRCRILAESLGDMLYPIFDKTGDMIAFMREYFDVDDDDDSDIRVVEIYTSTKTITLTQPKNRAGQAWVIEETTNVIGKIPVIYYSQAAPEWLDVQPAITRYEKLISNLGDSNDYYASPTTIVSGEIKGWNRKGETGKVLELEADAKVDLLEAKNGVESVTFEKETLKAEILEGSQTPDISFESMKGMGEFSGIALKMLFFDASLKVKNKLPTYGMSKQRSINYMVAALSKFDLSFAEAARMSISPKIEPYMPQNVEELVDMLTTAAGTKPIISQETAVSKNPLVDDPKEEIARIAKEVKDDQERELALQITQPGVTDPVGE